MKKIYENFFYKLKLFFISLTILGISQTALAYVNIYPVRFDKYIDGKEGTENYYLYNSTGRTVRYRIYTDKIKDVEKDMSSWIEYYPKSVTLKPGEEQIIKVQIKAPDNIQQGEYLAVLGVKEVPIPNIETENVIDVFTDLRIEIAGFIGDIKPELKTKNMRVKINRDKKIDVQGTIQNIGNRRGTFEFYFLNSKGKEKCLAGEIRLLKNREVDLDNTKIKITDEYMKENILKFDTFVVKEKGRSDRNIKSFKIEK